MDQETRAEATRALEWINAGLWILEALAEQDSADLKPAERRALLTALTDDIYPAMEGVTRALWEAQQRAPGKGKRTRFNTAVV